MKRRILYSLLTLTLGMTLLSAVPSVEATQQKDPLFDKLDVDQDRFISRAEASKDERVSERFDALDLNRDDQLDEVEFEALNEPVRPPQPTQP